MKACISHWQKACFCAKKRGQMLTSFCLKSMAEKVFLLEINLFRMDKGIKILDYQ